MKPITCLITACCLCICLTAIPTQGSDLPIPHARTMLLRDPLALDYLVINQSQRQQLGGLLDTVDYPLWQIRDHPISTRKNLVAQLLSQLRVGLASILTADQQRQYAFLVEEALDQSTLRPRSLNWSHVKNRACRAPEFTGVTTWINSSALTLASQRGRVAVVHFIAIDCSNCVANLPLYNQWASGYDSDQVTIIGIHRPETTRERSLDHVREKFKDHAITYPVAIDNNSKNWDAWANQVWPSIYLIDKAGFIRYWWYGELNYQGRRGDQWIRTRIHELRHERG